MLRHPYVVILFILVACSTSPAQESVTLSGNETVKAGETVDFTLTLDKAPNFEGGSINFEIGGPDGAINRSIETKVGQEVYHIGFLVPPGAAGGTWEVIHVRFSNGLKWMDLGFKKLSFQVIANPNLIYPSSAEVAISPSQVQLLRREATRLQLRIQALKASLAEQPKDTSGGRIVQILRRNIQEELGSLKETESMFHELASSKPQPETQVFFGDLRTSYEDVMAELQQGGPQLEMDVPLEPASFKQTARSSQRRTRYPVLAQAAFRAFEQNELAYKIVADTGTLTFDLEVNSTPTGATISYHRRGDPYRQNPKPTDTVIKALTYAIWIVRFEKPGYHDEEREHDPFREPNHVINVQLRQP